MMEDRLLYLYGVVPHGQPLPAAGALESVPFSSLAAVVEAVPSVDFSPEALEERLRSLEWLEGLARRHDAVLGEAMRLGPVVPARLCTLFSGEGALVEALEGRAQSFREALARVEGKQEWGLKVFGDREVLWSAAALDPEAAELQTRIAAAGPGLAYVLERRREARMAKAVSIRSDAVLDRILEAVETLAAELRFRPLLPGGPGSGEGLPPTVHQEMLLNAALLVESGAAQALLEKGQELGSRLESEGFRVEFTGPWAPYAFCDRE